jgi:hypothetical protein
MIFVRNPIGKKAKGFSIVPYKNVIGTHFKMTNMLVHYIRMTTKNK